MEAVERGERTRTTDQPLKPADDFTEANEGKEAVGTVLGAAPDREEYDRDGGLSTGARICNPLCTLWYGHCVGGLKPGLRTVGLARGAGIPI